jgi:ribonuclease M5
MKKKIKEVIVVEGKDDISAVKNAVDAEVFQVNGHAVRKNKSIELLKLAYENKGLIILTDPDYAGEEIRKYLCKHFPNAKNAYISRVSGTKDGDIGVENASPKDIITALEKARFSLDNSEKIFNLDLMIDYNLIGKDNSADLRALLGAELGIGYSNGKQFMAKLNRYGISLEEFEKAYEKINIK